VVGLRFADDYILSVRPCTPIADSWTVVPAGTGSWSSDKRWVSVGGESVPLRSVHGLPSDAPGLSLSMEENNIHKSTLCGQQDGWLICPDSTTLINITKDSPRADGACTCLE